MLPQSRNGGDPSAGYARVDFENWLLAGDFESEDEDPSLARTVALLRSLVLITYELGQAYAESRVPLSQPLNQLAMSLNDRVHTHLEHLCGGPASYLATYHPRIWRQSSSAYKAYREKYREVNAAVIKLALPARAYDRALDEEQFLPFDDRYDPSALKEALVKTLGSLYAAVDLLSSQLASIVAAAVVDG